jgi:hypothetical protein
MEDEMATNTAGAQVTSPEAADAQRLTELDPTMPAEPVNVAEYGFEGRFEDWTADGRYFEYSQAADPVGLGYTPRVPAEQFGPELYSGGATRIVPLDLSERHRQLVRWRIMDGRGWGGSVNVRCRSGGHVQPGDLVPGGE